MKVDFILSKDPATEHGGDVALTRLVMNLARESFDVHGHALSSSSGIFDDNIIRTTKPPKKAGALLRASLSSRRSTIHCRFDTPGLAQMLKESSADIFVAEHSYMAESFLRVRPEDSKQRLFVNSHVSEAAVWNLTQPKYLWWESERIKADEERIARAAKSVAYFDRDEAMLSVSSTPFWLNLTLPPENPVDRSRTPRRLLFLGDRTWPPNAEAAKKAVELWPRISEGISDAELLLVGKSSSGTAAKAGDGIRDLAFVDDLDGLLSSVRALIAPVSTGGGVRVKILEAARVGLPVVGTQQALGSLGEVLPITHSDSDEVFIQAARSYLLDPEKARRDGEAIHEANSARWKAAIPHQLVHDWLVAK